VFSLPKRIALYEHSFRGAVEVSFFKHLVAQGIRTRACDVEEDAHRNHVLHGLRCDTLRHYCGLNVKCATDRVSAATSFGTNTLPAEYNPLPALRGGGRGTGSKGLEGLIASKTNPE
jgi:hypothetical protein